MQYSVWAVWVGQPFWGDILGITVVLGEIVCWCHIIFQSEFLNCAEDTIWAIHAAMMAYYSQTWLQLTVFGLFSAYLFLLHLPRMYKRISPPFFPRVYNGSQVLIEKPDLDTKIWMAPMLLVMPILQAVIYYQINYGSL